MFFTSNKISFNNVKLNPEDIKNYSISISSIKQNNQVYVRINFVFSAVPTGYNWGVTFHDELVGNTINLKSKYNELPKGLLDSIRIYGDIFLTKEFIKNIEDSQCKKIIQSVGFTQKGYYLSDSDKEIVSNFVLSKILNSQKFNRTFENSINYDTNCHDENYICSFIQDFCDYGVKKFPLQGRALTKDGYNYFGYELTYYYNLEVAKEADGIISKALFNAPVYNVKIDSTKEDYDEGFDDLEESIKRHRKRLRF